MPAVPLHAARAAIANRSRATPSKLHAARPGKPHGVCGARVRPVTDQAPAWDPTNPEACDRCTRTAIYLEVR